MKKFKDSYLPETATRFRLGLVVFLVISSMEHIMFGGNFPLLVKLLIYLVNGVVAWGVAVMMSAGLDRIVVGSIGMHWATGEAALPVGFSEQEAFVARGDITGAIASYRSRILSAKSDIEGRIRLGLLLTRAGEFAEAEQWLLEARILGASAEQERPLGNAMIDLYRASGERPKLKAELARFARNHPGSEAGRQAHQYLRQLTAEDAETDQPY
jgi:hypothetical protein